jgi:Fe-S cluster assembly protein SufD
MLSDGQLRDLMTARAEGAVPWLSSLRERARTKFGGLPTRRVEAWKYSDLARALEDTPQAETGEALPPLILVGADLVQFEDGLLMRAPEDMQSLRQVLGDPMAPMAALIGTINPQTDHALLQLNTALMEDGLILHVPRGVRRDKPVQIRFSWPEGAEGRHLRLVIVLEEGAQLTLLETHEGAPSFASIVTEAKLGAGAQLTHTRLERLGAGARQAAITLAELGRSSSYRAFYLSEGAAFARHEALIRLAGEGAEAVLDGAFLVTGARHCDNTTVLTHDAQKTVSRQAFRGVLSGSARGVYQGAVSVKPSAQGTDARQLSRTVLLSHKAEIATKPELEILADDIKCSHGASAGELDHDALFFLRARGIPESEARGLLVSAFLDEALQAIGDEDQRLLATDAVHHWLERHAGEVSHVE